MTCPGLARVGAARPVSRVLDRIFPQLLSGGSAAIPTADGHHATTGCTPRGGVRNAGALKLVSSPAHPALVFAASRGVASFSAITGSPFSLKARSTKANEFPSMSLAFDFHTVEVDPCRHFPSDSVLPVPLKCSWDISGE